MKKLLSIIAFLFFAYTANAQSSVGLIDPPRATDWTQTGIPGGIPSGSWTQCITTACATVTSAGVAATSAQITAALNSALNNTYVLLAPGCCILTSAIVITNKNNVELRGSGADSTFLTFAANTPGGLCEGGSSHCGLGFTTSDGSYWGSPTGLTNWTAGFAQGTNSITLQSVNGILKTTGAPTIPATLIIVDQDDDGYTGTTVPPTGSAVDTGNYYACADAYNAAVPTGCAQTGQGPDNGFQRAKRIQQEMFEATNIVGNVVTVTPNIIHPNWRVGQSPQAWLLQPNNYVGFKDFSIDCQNTTANTCIGFGGISYGWTRGVRVINGKQSGISTWMCTHMNIVDNYVYDSGQNYTFSDNYGIRLESSPLILVQNNILQKNSIQFLIEGPAAGVVVGYNFAVNNYNNTDAMDDAYRPHAAGDDYQLYEGDIGSDVFLDKDHGTHLMNTVYRNFFTGFESCGSVAGICGSPATFGGTYPAGTYGHKDANVYAINVYGFNRYGNYIANVLGTPGETTSYRPVCGTNFSVYILGCSFDVSLTNSTSYFWGNWDAKTLATRWCGNASSTGWVATCGSVSEVPTGFAVYPQPLPTLGDIGGALPKSLYLPTSPAPSWFGSIAWPPIGPDVTGGTVGQCGGAKDSVGNFALLAATNSSQCNGQGITMSAWAGHVNANPAMKCYLETMSGPPDGRGSALSFNADTCYVTASAPVVLLTTFPMDFGAHVVGVGSGAQIATLKNSGTATLTYSLISVTGTNSADFVVTPGLSNPCVILGSTLAAGVSCTVNIVFTPSVCGGGYPCAKTANLRVDSNATSTPDLGVLTGTSTAAPTGSGTPSMPTLTGMLWNFDRYAFYKCTPYPCATACYSCSVPFGVKRPVITFK